MKIMLLLGLLLQAKPSMEELIRALGDDDPKVRERASEDLVKRWEEWSEADLGKLEAGGKDSGAEVRARCKEGLRRIKVARVVGAKVLKTIPEFLNVMDSASETEKLMLLGKVAYEIKEGKINPPLTEEEIKGFVDVARGWKLSKVYSARGQVEVSRYCWGRSRCRGCGEAWNTRVCNGSSRFRVQHGRDRKPHFLTEASIIVPLVTAKVLLSPTL
jgi:hypothetical protein